MLVERKGNTLHLLKQGSKAVPQERKRRKISLAGTPQQWNEIHSQPASQAMQPDPVQAAQLAQEEVKLEEPARSEDDLLAGDMMPPTATMSKRQRKKAAEF